MRCAPLALWATLSMAALAAAAGADCAPGAGGERALVLGGGSAGAEAAAHVAALLLGALVPPLAACVRAAPPPPCLRSLAAPACAPALRDRLATAEHVPDFPTVELGVAVGAATNLSVRSLRGYVVDYLGDLAPPARLSCLAAAAGRPAVAALSDLARPDLASEYALSADELTVVREMARDHRGGFHWNGEGVTDGSFVPDRCRSGPACAHVLTDGAGDADALAALVTRRRLRAAVLSLGRNLTSAVRLLPRRPLLLCAWAPRHGTLAAALPPDAAELDVPACDPAGEEPCPFETRRLAKLANAATMAREPRALPPLSRMSFTRDLYAELQTLSEESGPAEGARAWFARHEDVARDWARPDGEPWVNAILPLNESARFSARGLRAELGARRPCAGGRCPSVRVADSTCELRRADKTLWDALLGREYASLAALVAPPCSPALGAVAALAAGVELPVVAFAPAVPEANPPGGRWLVLAAGDARDTAAALGALLAHCGWRRLAALAEAGARHAVDEARLGADVVHHVTLPDAHDPADYEAVRQWAAEAARRGARVLALAVEDARVARAALCAGREAGLTPAAGAVWLLPAALPDGWPERAAGDAHACASEELREMAEGHLSLGGAWLAAGEGGGAEASAWRAEWRARCPAAECGARPPPHAALLHDVLRLLTGAMAALRAERPALAANPRLGGYGRALIERIAGSNFTGLTGAFRFREDLARVVAVDVFQWEAGARRAVGRYDPEARALALAGPLRWRTPGGRRPGDGEDCALRGLADLLRCDCRTAFAALGGAALAALAAALAGGFAYCRRRVEREYRRRLRAAGFGALEALRRKAAGLDRWEVPRERVVINRRLGAGAFGAVYGGHALLHEARGWTAVAVKTLKHGADTEEKLDFLSEAESMKRFEHKNVVRLLGVVTATEPVCTVMELMLYGDLKSFLVARRHLAQGAEGRAGEEVAPRRLTGWALDAARALSYLAEMRYVHRDVAARNCLLSAKRVLKLADFGMTRLVFENDYYRFGRKGMLPVRWMAPESLCLGVFSSASDIWSFGVLLYEIVTFGALPFQGLANHEVLARVKAGGTAPLPPGLKPQLEGLMKSCWRREHKERPRAAEVAALLADSPRLLTPCLDVPLEALSLEAEARGRGAGAGAGAPRLVRAADAWRAAEGSAGSEFRARRDTGGSNARSNATDATYLSAEAEAEAEPGAADAFLP